MFTFLRHEFHLFAPGFLFADQSLFPQPLQFPELHLKIHLFRTVSPSGADSTSMIFQLPFRLQVPFLRAALDSTHSHSARAAEKSP